MGIQIYAQPQTYNWTASEHALLGWSCDIAATSAAGSIPGVAGTLNLIRVHVPIACSVTNILMYAGVAGSSLTSGQCFAALYTAAGARVGVTADQATPWASSGLKTMALASGPFAVAAGDAYVGFWHNGTTAPTWARAAGFGGPITNVGLSAPNLRCATADTGLTTTAPANLGAQTAAAILYWVGLS